MSGRRPLAREEKEDNLPVSSHGFFSLKEMCLDKFLSKEHTVGKENTKQSLGLLYDEYKQFKQKKLKSLLEAILWGDPKTTLELIDQYPVLLLEKLEEKLELNGVEVEGEVAEAPSGHKTTNTTAYRLALAVEDTELEAEIRARLIALAGKEAAEAQWQEQFPEGWEATEEKAWEPIFNQLKVLTQAILHAAPGDIISSGHPHYQLTVREGSNLDNALKQFRSLLDLKVNEIITTGRQFNPQLLLCAYKIYHHYYDNDDFENCRDPRALLFLQRVIGYIQRSLPANYIQAFCDGLNNTEEKLRKGEPHSRSLKFRAYDTTRECRIYTDFYPLSGSHIGFNVALFSGVGIGCFRRAMPPLSSVDIFTKLISIKNSRHAEFMKMKIGTLFNPRNK